MHSIEIMSSNISEIGEIIKLHINSLVNPMDSWLEDRLLESDIYRLVDKGKTIGYAGIIKETLQYFHVLKEFFNLAPAAFEKVISEKSVKRVFIMTQDSLLSALIAEWNFDKEKHSCCFTDCGRTENACMQLNSAVFRAADLKDTYRIRQLSGDFFDEVSGGFSCLEERIGAGTIFVLADHTDIWGCGVVEKGQFFTDCVSIGMFTNPQYRKKGVARMVLLNLKAWAYKNNLRPVAGCWYYNTLSRKSLESAGMVAASIGYEAILKGKEKLPLRTGNPPGELIGE